MCLLISSARASSVAASIPAGHGQDKIMDRTERRVIEEGRHLGGNAKSRNVPGRHGIGQASRPRTQ